MPQDEWNTIDMPGLHGVSETAPYLCNNSAATLESVVDHHLELFMRVQMNAAPGAVPPVASTDGISVDRRPTPEERAALIAYFRTL